MGATLKGVNLLLSGKQATCIASSLTDMFLRNSFFVTLPSYFTDKLATLVSGSLLESLEEGLWGSKPPGGS